MDQKGGYYPPQAGAPYPPQQPGAPGAPPPYPGQPGPYQQGYPPPQPGFAQPGYPQGGPVPAATVVVAAPMRFGETPISMKCQYCYADIVTGTTYESGLGTWLVAGACCVFGLWAGCCLIPFCVDGLKDVIHTCPNCNRAVGKYSRIS